MQKTPDTTMSKYHATKTVVDGITFDSKKEALRYVQLKRLESDGLIIGLQLQPKWTLVPSGKRADGKTERKVEYRADFMYSTPDGQIVVEDVKGVRTKEYIIKRKLMLYVHGISITEI